MLNLQTRLKGDDLTSFIATQRPHVILSTYGTVTQDADELQIIDWSTVALDEAQNIKNMQTLQSRAIRKLKGDLFYFVVDRYKR